MVLRLWAMCELDNYFNYFPISPYPSFRGGQVAPPKAVIEPKCAPEGIFAQSGHSVWRSGRLLCVTLVETLFSLNVLHGIIILSKLISRKHRLTALWWHVLLLISHVFVLKNGGANFPHWFLRYHIIQNFIPIISMVQIMVPPPASSNALTYKYKTII